jgi:hypothetical protein
LRIVGSEKELMKARMALYDAARIVLNNGMRLLGLSPVERYVHFFSSIYDQVTNVNAECEE